MAPMNSNYLNRVADHGGAGITHVALFNDVGAELSGGVPAYARKPVTWTAAAGGTIRPTANLVFDVPASAVVSEWRGFSAVTAGTDYGGADLVNETFAAQGTYTLLAASSGILHSSS